MPKPLESLSLEELLALQGIYPPVVGESQEEWYARATAAEEVTEGAEAELAYQYTLIGQALELYTLRKLWESTQDRDWLYDLQDEALAVLRGTGAKSLDAALAVLDDDTAHEIRLAQAELSGIGVDVNWWFNDEVAWLSSVYDYTQREVWQEVIETNTGLAAGFQELTAKIAEYLMHGEEALEDDLNEPGFVEFMFFGAAMETAGAKTLETLLGTFFEDVPE